jgi:arginyl-tRNA synthetase
MKNQLVDLLNSILAEMGISNAAPEVEISDNPLHGEYTTNVAMKLAKVLKKSPMEIAGEIKEAVSFNGQHPNTSKKDRTKSVKLAKLDQFSVLQAIDRVEVAPPGFINFFLTEATLSTSLRSVLKEKESYGMSQEKGKRIIIEFTDPNPFKEFHIGHLYSNAVGESICRLFEASGQDVRRVNYQGDVGMHVAKSIWGMKKKLSNLTNVEKLSLPERVKWMGEVYALGAQAYENNPKEAEEIKNMNYLVFIAAQEYLQEKEGWTPQVNYRQYVTVNDADLAVVRKLYESGRTWSLLYFETLYRRLGTAFKGYYFESKVGEMGAKIVREHIADGIFDQSDGAIIFRGENVGLHTRVFINKLGLPTYEAKELGLAPMKEQDWHYDASYIITAKEIDEYFKVLIAAMLQVAPELGAKTIHIGHGIVRLPEGKMSSRTGNILTGESLLDSLKQKINTILDKSETKYDKKESELIAERAAVAAVKYSLLKVALPSDITFDMEKSVSFEGDSGPYLLYTYARCKSVLRKAGDHSCQLSAVSCQLNPEERAVCRLIAHFPDVVAGAAATLSPSSICTYLNRLASSFNLFYAKHSILAKPSAVSGQLSAEERAESGKPALPAGGLQAESSLRISLTAATAQVLANGLSLLGIKTVERM